MSGLRAGLWAAVSAALLVCAVPAGAQPDDGAPADGTLPGGVAYVVRPDPAQAGAVVALWYRAPAGGFDAKPVPGISRLAAATVAASSPITGTSLVRLVEGWGGRVSVAAFPDSVAISVLVPPGHAAQAVRAMTADYFAPVVTAAGLTVAQTDAAEDTIYRSLGSEAIDDALGAALFSSGPLHDGTIASASTLATLKLDRVRAFAERAFRPSNALLVVTGAATRGVLTSVVGRAGAAAGSPEPPAPQAARTDPAPIRREATVAGTGLGWVGPPIDAEADATALDFLAEALFAPKTGIVSKAIGARKATVTGKFVTYRRPGVFLVTITGADAEAVRPIVEGAIADAAHPMPPAAFQAARAAFVYRIAGDLAGPVEWADTFGWYTIEGNPGYAPAQGGLGSRYFGLVAQLDPVAVARVAATYLGRPPAVVTLVKSPPAKAART